MKIALAIVACTTLILLWFLLHDSQSSITNYPPKNDIVVAFGDSLVFGYGATTGNDFVSLLAGKLGRQIVNLGVSGDTTAEGLLRIDTALTYDPGTVILLLGGNDYLQKVPEVETKARLGTMIETFQKNGSVVVLLGVRGGIVRDNRNAMYESLSETYGTVYVEDVLDGVFLKPELMFDGIHPNDIGYKVIAERVYEALEEYDLVEVMGE